MLSPPAEVTACCWDANTSGMLGLCGADGSFVLANYDHEQGTKPGCLCLEVFWVQACLDYSMSTGILTLFVTLSPLLS